MKLRLLFSSILSLSFGTIIYLLFRVSTLNVFSWIDILNIDFTNFYLRKFMISKIDMFPDWFVFSLPDGLWIFSYVNLILLIWNFKINFQSLIWILIVPSISIISEIGQGLKIIRGTFDFLDLLFYALGFILPLIFTRENLKFKYYEKN
ncbi:hypothetical protein GCM10023210_14540 [Chryseobacterium ginsengisoli]|uniref:DUF2809 domain-containing protein n=1 Tax=Chryseobacterium ginsengisoli TaxID=363853 RepID=A0ABP9M5H3_9FLAO